jgi:hypothetical protein
MMPRKLRTTLAAAVPALAAASVAGSASAAVIIDFEDARVIFGGCFWNLC